MSWHQLGYTASLGAGPNLDTPAVSDDVITIFNGHFQLRQPMNLVAVYAVGALLNRVRLDSPTLRFYGNPQVRPYDVAAVPANNYNVMQYWKSPLRLPAGEEIAVQIGNSGAGPTRSSAFLSVQQTMEPVMGGNVYALRLTSTTAAVALSWTTLTYTMDQTFPEGLFDMVFSEVQSATILNHRWIFDVQMERPGFPGTAVLGNRSPYDLIQLNLGKMGTFYNISLPRLQVFCTGADASFDAYMYIVPRGPAAQASRGIV